jgi:hypothetical protein
MQRQFRLHPEHQITMKKLLLFSSVLLSACLLNAQATGPGKALSFPGTASYVEATGSESWDFSNAITVEAWIQPTAFGTFSYSNTIASNSATTGGNKGFDLRCGANGKLSFNFASGGTWHEVVTTDVVLATSKPNHVAGVFAGNQLRLYLNGVLKGTTNFTGTITDSTLPMRVGMMSNTANGNRSFTGTIDEVRVWSAALSENTIRTYMCQKINDMHPNYASLKVHYNFDEGSGSTTMDQSPAGLDGTLVGTLGWPYSTAPIGDVSIFSYTLPLDLTLASSYGDALKISGVSASNLGMHIYLVESGPSQAIFQTPMNVMDQTHYFGMFFTNITNTTCTVKYFASGGPLYDATVCAPLLAQRNTNAVATWTTSGATWNADEESLSVVLINRREFTFAAKNPAPLFENESETMCPGGTLDLTVMSVDSLNYSWILNGEEVGTGTSSTFTATEMGTYWVTVDGGGGCMQTSPPVQVDSYTLPNVSVSELSICEGDNVLTLSSGMPAGGTYYYNGSPATEVQIAFLEAGEYTYGYEIVSVDGCEVMAEGTFVINSLPDAPSVVVNGWTLTSSSSTGNQWYNDNGMINGATNQSYQATGIGDYYVTYTDPATGCTSLPSELAETVGVGELQAAALIVYPNPASDMITISFAAPIQVLKVIDAHGRVVLVQRPAMNSSQVDVSALTSGYYVLHATVSGGQVVRQPVLIQR